MLQNFQGSQGDNEGPTVYTANILINFEWWP